jgi:hypothetical protein
MTRVKAIYRSWAIPLTSFRMVGNHGVIVGKRYAAIFAPEILWWLDGYLNHLRLGPRGIADAGFAGLLAAKAFNTSIKF